MLMKVISFLLNIFNIFNIKNIKFRYPRFYNFMQISIVCLAGSALIYFFALFKNKDHVDNIVGCITIIAIMLIYISGIIYISLHHYVYTIKINNIKYAIVGCDSHKFKLVKFYSYTDTSSARADNFSFNEYKPYKWISYEQAYDIKNDFKTEIVPINIERIINMSFNWLRNHKYTFLTLKSVLVVLAFYMAIEIIFEILHLYVQFTSIFG